MYRSSLINWAVLSDFGTKNIASPPIDVFFVDSDVSVFPNEMMRKVSLTR